jgi:hypothetical protein
MRTHTTAIHIITCVQRAGVACRSNLRQPLPRPSSFRNSESKVCEGALACTHCPASTGFAEGRPTRSATQQRRLGGILERRLISEAGTSRGGPKMIVCDESTSSWSARLHRTAIGARSTAERLSVAWLLELSLSVVDGGAGCRSWAAAVLRESAAEAAHTGRALVNTVAARASSRIAGCGRSRNRQCKLADLARYHVHTCKKVPGTAQTMTTSIMRCLLSNRSSTSYSTSDSIIESMLLQLAARVLPNAAGRVGVRDLVRPIPHA